VTGNPNEYAGKVKPQGLDTRLVHVYISWRTVIKLFLGDQHCSPPPNLIRQRRRSQYAYGNETMAG
jgi:hypothetical protein